MRHDVVALATTRQTPPPSPRGGGFTLVDETRPSPEVYFEVINSRLRVNLPVARVARS